MPATPAPLKSRFLALGIDYLVILAYGLFLLGSTLVFYQTVFHGIPNLFELVGTGGTQLIGFMTLTLPIGLYFYLMESGQRHATLGKRAAKLQVAPVTGKSVSKKQILMRTIVKLLPWEFAHTFVYQVVHYSQNGGTPPVWVMIGLTIANILPLLYLAMIVLRKDHRGPHDIAGQTIIAPAK